MPPVSSLRRCSRSGCPRPAVATLTYVYAQSTAVVGPLAVRREPHTYDLCELHARGLTAPRGWHLVRHDGEFGPPPDDLTAVAEAVREVGLPRVPSATARAGAGYPRSPSAGPGRPTPGPATVGRRAHLRVIPPA